MKCQDCLDTGWVGDNGPGKRGNNEYMPCDCEQGKVIAASVKGRPASEISTAELKDELHRRHATVEPEPLAGLAHRKGYIVDLDYYLRGPNCAVECVVSTEAAARSYLGTFPDVDEAKKEDEGATE